MTATEAPASTTNLTDRLFMEGVGSAHMFTVYLGVRLGLYKELDAHPSITADRLASVSGLDERYVREWLQAETIAGLVLADAEDLQVARFELAPGIAEVLVDETAPDYLGGLAYAVAAIGGVTRELLDAFHTGDGVPYSAYGPEAIHAQGALNRPAFVNLLVTDWLPAMPAVHARLEDRERPARVADIGCGVGWAAIELAKAFPHIKVDGFDADELSIKQARANAVEHGVADRATFGVVDATSAGLEDGAYDLVLFLECVHDLGRPVEALAAARAAVATDGTVLVMDERTGDRRPAAGDPIETFFATVSVLWCLPQSRVTPDCEAPGTVMRPAQLTAFARRAGWADVEVMPVEHPFFRFYRLIPKGE